MFKDDVLRYFKKKRLVAEALGISHVAVVRWKAVIPALLQIVGGDKLIIPFC
ncbi:Cro/CI family transcriptional regulator [Escherichia coli]|uniref:Cro/CI family transcriptional regulator n=1 Tax=Escherichia coli TaxID=562 RepID=UPI0025B3C1DB|nr:Cro/CI family transcriptional regulator [Escherichia coli]MDN3837232.1 Cro/CI family transcriptional regulator [Escherichia coli]